MNRGAVASRAAPPAPQRPLLGAFAVVATWILLLAVPLVCGAFFLSASYAHDTLAYDFRHAYLPAAEAVLDGESPYPGLDDPRLAAETAYVYPPPLAYALVPFTALPANAAYVAAALLALALLMGTLVVAGVRDWRCYGATLLWAPSLIAVQTASSSVLLAFVAALSWRYRNTAWPVSAAIGAGLAVKLVVWPLLVWTAATRRFRATAGAVLVAAGAILLAWAALGFEDLGRYPSLLRRLTELEAADTYSFTGIADALGLPDAAGQAASLLIGSALLLACVLLGRRGDDLGSFTAAIAATLAFTPILWQHYLVLLLVPLAVARPRFSALWLLPVILWLAPREDNGQALQTLLPLGVAAVLAAALLMRAREVPTASPVAGSQ